MPEKRQRDIPDDADEKWSYPEHTAAKHEILRRYLGAWLSILGRGRHQRLVLLDGFAGGASTWKVSRARRPSCSSVRLRSPMLDRYRRSWFAAQSPMRPTSHTLKRSATTSTIRRSRSIRP